MGENCGKQTHVAPGFCQERVGVGAALFGSWFGTACSKRQLVLGDELEHGIQKLSLSARLSVSDRRRYARLSFLVTRLSAATVSSLR